MQKGEGKLGAVIWILLFVIVVLISKEAIPVKMRSSQLYDFMVELTKFSANRPPEFLQKKILSRARELDIPLQKKDVHIRVGNGRIRLRAVYTEPVEMPLFTYNWDFNLYVDRPIFII